jgi:hypothetical protein
MVYLPTLEANATNKELHFCSPYTLSLQFEIGILLTFTPLITRLRGLIAKMRLISGINIALLFRGLGKGGKSMDEAKKRLILFVLFLSTSLAIFFAFLTLTASIS